TLSASSGFQSLELDKWLNTNSIFATFVGGLTQPLLNGRRIKTEYEVAKAQQEEAFLSFKQSLLQAGKEVSDALTRITTADEKIYLKTAEYEAYNEAMNYSEELLNYGLANYLEVLTARESSLNAQLSVTITKFEKLSATIELYRALGGGWQ
ncbi:MAG TPA: TolC family protein, partial [Flavobacteriaceae bacterium]|nr:TolC family protein [Flavobacteriaceae bacterium]